MGSMTVVNADTLGKRLGIAALYVGVAMALAYSGKHVANRLESRREYASRKQTVIEAITAKEYDKADSVLKSLNADRALRPEDVAALHADIVKGIKERDCDHDLEHALETDDTETALRMVETLQRTGNCPRGKITAARLKIDGATEQNVYERLQATLEHGQRIALAGEYLKRFPQGQYHTKAIEALLISSIAELSDALTNRTDFDAVYAQLIKTNQLLEQYRAEQRVVLTDITPPALINGQVESYLKDVQYRRAEGPITIGSIVQIMTFRGSDDAHSEPYLKDRNKAIAVGSRGTVVDSGDDIEVQFNGTYAGKWESDWNTVVSHWDGQKKSVAGYRTNELLHVRPITEIQRNLFCREVKILSGRMEEYR